MAIIAFVTLPMKGPFNSTLKLARDLRNNGHRVCYLGLPDGEDEARSNGFDFIPVFEKWFPKGFFRKYDSAPLMDRAKALQAAREVSTVFIDFLEALINEQDHSFFETIGQLKPDLMLFEHSGETVSIPALLAHKAGIKCVYLSSMLSRTEDAIIPPASSGLIPASSLVSRVRIWAVWKKIYFRRLIREKVQAMAGIGVDWPKLMTRLARTCGYPVQLLERNSDVASIKLALPELVLWPEAFEFPGAAKPGRYYLGAAIDMERRKADFPMEKLDGRRPLAYCATGTIAWLKPAECIDFYRTIIRASTVRPDWQWVIDIGGDLKPGDFEALPENVMIVQRAPQLEMLKRAHLMITHGGANSTKECIYFGVPMIIFPEKYDHPGNAARAIYHGLGVKGDARRLTVDAMRSLIERVDKSPYIRTRMRLMQEKFRETESLNTGLKLVETILDSPHSRFQ